MGPLYPLFRQINTKSARRSGSAPVSSDAKWHPSIRYPNVTPNQLLLGKAENVGEFFHLGVGHSFRLKAHVPGRYVNLGRLIQDIHLVKGATINPHLTTVSIYLLNIIIRFFLVLSVMAI